MNYKLLLTTSGTGSRLGELTQNTNKSVLEIGGKTIASHIIDNYPDNIDIVVTVGYHGKDVKNKLEEIYKTRNISFVQISPYEGPGSSLGFSMLQAKDLLQCPFIFHACDTIIPKNGLEPNFNRCLGYKTKDSIPYTTFNIGENGKIKNFNKGKGAKQFDFAHIGVCGIHDYEKFWEKLEKLYNEDKSNTSLNDVSAISAMIDDGIEFKYFEEKNWLDTGNLEGFERAKQILNN